MATTKMQLVDWLDDLCVRFIINLPHEELASVERICFQIEEAQWFYEDFIRPLDPSLPSMNLRKFCLVIFQHCPLLSDFSPNYHAMAYSEFLIYKTRVPVRGAIMLNADMDEVVLVKGWKKGSRWGFPRGKINKDEKDLDCAVREVYEETGFDIQKAGLVKDESEMKYIEVTMREQHMRLYVFRGVPKSTHFEPKTRKEISKIEWYKLSDLPTQKKQQQRHGQDADDSVNNSMFYMVAPFLGPLRRWIKQQKKLDRAKAPHGQHLQPEIEELDPAEESAALAGETTADEDMSAYVQASKAQDDHFGRLLAGLRSSEQPVSPATMAPETTSDQPSGDPASELKRLLSVSGPSAQSQASNPLLAMLRGSDPAASQPIPQGNMQPRTPFDQIVNVPPLPQSPHHHHPRPPHFSAMQPPPSFPYPPGQHPNQLPPNIAPRNYPQPQQAQRIGGRATRPSQAHSNVHPASRPPMGVVHPPNVFPPQPQFQGQGPPMHQQSQPPPANLFNRGGDAHHVQNPRFPSVHGPAIPSASQLPAPKLNAHTVNLLNAFKNPEVAKAAIASQGQAKFAEVYSSGRPGQGQPSQQPPQPESRKPGPSAAASGLETLVGEMSPPTAESPTPLMAAQQMPIPTMQPKPRSAHQDALLNLFRAPSTSATSPLQALLPGARAPEPVELAAQPSPGMARLPLSRPVESQPSPPAKLSIPTFSEQFTNQHPHLTSATVSGPLNEPNFDTLQRQRQTPQPPLVEANGKPIDPTTRSTRASPHVPTSATPITPPSGLSSSGPLLTNRDEGAQQLPFHPTILRRPNPAEAPQPAAPAFDRREALPEQQKNTLLSLFGKGAPQPSGITSPVSPLPEKAMLMQPPQTNSPHAAESMQRSRISSIASLSTGEAIKELDGTGALPGKPLGVAAQAQQQQQKTPVTPVDRSFLLGYLEGVAKGDRK